MSVFFQKNVSVGTYPKGYHLITENIIAAIPEVSGMTVGILHIFLQHTSCGLCINENADPGVRKDFKTFIDDLIPDTYPRFVHTYEGTDDMPAHIKSAFFGTSVQVPISGGKLALGIWQGIYLCEFRQHGGPRNLVITAFGKSLSTKNP